MPADESRGSGHQHSRHRDRPRAGCNSSSMLETGRATACITGGFVTPGCLVIDERGRTCILRLPPLAATACLIVHRRTSISQSVVLAILSVSCAPVVHFASAPDMAAGSHSARGLGGKDPGTRRPRRRRVGQAAHPLLARRRRSDPAPEHPRGEVQQGRHYRQRPQPQHQLQGRSRLATGQLPR